MPKKNEEECDIVQELKGFGYQVLSASRAYNLVAVEVVDETCGIHQFGVGVTVLDALKRLRVKLHLKSA